MRDYPKSQRDPSSHRTREQIRELDSGYNHSAEQIHKRSERNHARREMMKQGRVHKGDGRDVDHVRMLKDGGSNAPANWRVISQHKNRGWMRDQ